MSKPKSPNEILNSLINEANRIQKLTNDIDQKVNLFYEVQQKFIENGKQITNEQKEILDQLNGFEMPQISLDSYSKNELENIRIYEKELRKKDRTIPYFFFFTMLLLVGYIHFYNKGLQTKKEVREELFHEIYSNGDTIVSKNEHEKLIKNTQIIKLWIEENPKESKHFKRFLKEK